MPGHAPGHVAFWFADLDVVISGDCLFAGSIGRTDLPGGSHEVLMQSIRNVLLPLGEQVTVLPGHGPQTTLGQERRTNPFLAMSSPG
jgi:glyoxylase-like metal-dependent hydrolase (beta-lactamase superfamily II)